MKAFSSALSKKANWKEALKELSDKIQKDLDGRTCDMAIYFVSELFKDFDAQAFALALSDSLPYRVLIGCNSSGVVFNSSEIEMEPAVSMLAMHLPDIKLYPFYMPSDDVNLLKHAPDLINFLDIFLFIIIE